MLFFGVCFFLYFIRFSAGTGFFHKVLPLSTSISSVSLTKADVFFSRIYLPEQEFLVSAAKEREHST